MITINNKKYDNISVKVSFGEYDVMQCGKKKNGIAPILLFEFDNTFLKLETIYDKNMLKKLSLNDKNDVSKYISDISYEDEKGWFSLITGNYNCFICRIDNNVFDIEFNCETEECCEYCKISLNERVIINFE